ncbi:tetratricopeptide repeat protein [soil metagenome]
MTVVDKARPGLDALLEAERGLRILLATDPDQPAALGKLAHVLQDQGKLSEAIAMYRHLARLDPRDANVFFNLGNALRLSGDLAPAVLAFRQAVALNDGDFEAHHLLGNALRDQQQGGEAELCYQKALKVNPQFCEPLIDLGNLLRSQGKESEARDCYRQAIEMRPQFALAHYNLGVSLMEQGTMEEAIACYRRAMAHDPALVEAQWNCALALLMTGRYSGGWPLFEARLQKPPKLADRFSEPHWQGQDLSGKTLLVHAEQGFGDTLQFVRYLDLICEKNRPAKLILECQPELTRLLGCMSRMAHILAGTRDPLPAFDFHIPLLSLPLLFDTRVETIPASIPYIAVDDALQEKWRQRLTAEGRKKIGIAWAGRPTHPHDLRRSIPFHALGSLFAQEDCCFISLQKNAQNTTLRLIDWTAELHDFADTAALIAQLDLVICVDTAVAHLAGALGKPVWLMNAFESEWRWMLERGDSPWYPGMRIFRQTVRGQWAAVIDQLAAELQRSSA